MRAKLLLLLATLALLPVVILAGRTAAPAPHIEIRAGTSETPAAATALDAGFEPNRGQLDPRVEFVSRGAGYTLFLTGPGAALALDPAPDGAPGTRASLRMQFDGAIAYGPGTPARPLRASRTT